MLIKTSRSGVGVDERMVARIVRRGGGDGGKEFVGKSGRRGRNASVLKHREGNKVGKICGFCFFSWFL
jgi:hypothetical protein